MFVFSNCPFLRCLLFRFQRLVFLNILANQTFFNFIFLIIMFRVFNIAKIFQKSNVYRLQKIEFSQNIVFIYLFKDNKCHKLCASVNLRIVSPKIEVPQGPVSKSIQSVILDSSYRARTLFLASDLICDVIYEKGPYCGTNIIGPDQTPRIMRGV